MYICIYVSVSLFLSVAGVCVGYVCVCMCHSGNYELCPCIDFAVYVCAGQSWFAYQKISSLFSSHLSWKEGKVPSLRIASWLLVPCSMCKVVCVCVKFVCRSTWLSCKWPRWLLAPSWLLQTLTLLLRHPHPKIRLWHADPR